MRVRVVKMFKLGVEVERRMLLDRSTRQYRGELVIIDVTDQGRHRPVKVARLMSERGAECKLLDVHVVWANGDRITFTGDERILNAEGTPVIYKQSLLCTLEGGLTVEQESNGPDRKFKLPPR
jgi:hypothetical protein